MNIGERDREIVVEFKSAGQSGSGEPTETWGSPETLWAKVRSLNGREYYSLMAQQIVAEEMLVFNLYWRADVRPGTSRIKYNAGGAERIYNVRRVEEIGRRAELNVFADTAVA